MTAGIPVGKRARYLLFNTVFRGAYTGDSEWRYWLARHLLFEDRQTAAALVANRQATGSLDGEIDGDVYGWAIDTVQPAIPPKVLIYAHGKPIRDVCPVWYRGDVGPHAFYVDLSEFHGGEQNVPVEARFTDGQPLKNSPMLVTPPPSKTPNHFQAVLFLHIPKTGGIAFREAILGNYKPSQVAMIYPDEPGFLPCQFGSLPLEQRARFRFVMGHFHWGVHKFLPQDSTYVTIVREPVERVISHFLFAFSDLVARTAESEIPALLVKTMERTISFDNPMVRLVGGLSDHVSPGHVDREAYERALHNIRTQFSFVGYQDRTARAYAELKQRFGWRARPALDVVNRGAPWDMERFEQLRSSIEHFNRWDVKLYADIRKLFP